jgi:hypothetical protein
VEDHWAAIFDQVRYCRQGDKRRKKDHQEKAPEHIEDPLDLGFKLVCQELGR